MNDDAPQKPEQGTKKQPRSLLWRVLRSAIFIYLAVVGIVFFIQRRLQYLPNTASPTAGPGIEEVELTAKDGVKLRAWHWRAKTDRPTVLIFHGNAGHRGHREFWSVELRKYDVGVFILDYRGYGGSEGSPTEEGLYLDAEAALAWLEKNGVTDLYYFGESLGCGVAVELATRKSPRALVLHSGYSSTVDVGKSVYPFLPVGLMMWDRFECMERIKRIGCPLTMFHGEQDRIIPIELGRKLFDAAVEPKTWVPIAEAGHNDLLLIDTYREKIGELLRGP